MAGTFIVVATDLVAVSVFEVRSEDLKEVEYFDCGLVRDRPQWDALVAGV
jgi:hypothetical protein